MPGINRSTLDDVLAIQDPLYSDNYELSCVLPQGLLGKTQDKEALRIQCRSLSMPGIMNEAQDITLHGFKISTAGRTVFSNTLSVTYIENRKLSIYKTLKNWVNTVRDFRTQRSVGKSQYSTTGSLVIYDETLKEITTIKLANLFCSEVQDVSFDGSSANIVEISATFRYDFADESEKANGKTGENS